LSELETIGPEVALQVAQLEPPSFCVACDAREGECGHGGARYHESWFEYQTAPGSGKIDPQYRDWFDANPHGFENQEERPAPKARPFEKILAELEPWIFLNESLRSRLEEAYHSNPLQTSLMSADLRFALEAGKLLNPGGTLVNRLKGIKPAQLS
jgi:hypothetical protein